jgi:hypothetical protein
MYYCPTVCTVFPSQTLSVERWHLTTSIERDSEMGELSEVNITTRVQCPLTVSYLQYH